MLAGKIVVAESYRASWGKSISFQALYNLSWKPEDELDLLL